MTETLMAQETRQIPAVLSRQLSEGAPLYREIGARLRRLDPAVVVTAARGSSDHAALYFKYLAETYTGCPVASIGPSIASIYKASLRLERGAMLAISQSGASPDLLSLLDAGRRGGALTIALVNADNAPAADHVDIAAPLLAGPEIAVAATKSYVASLAAAAHIVAAWSGDGELATALDRLPGVIEAGLDADWSRADAAFADEGPIFTVGRGMGLSIAEEAALKFKETCSLHAEAYSSAEVLHGPVALADARLRALFFVSADESREGILSTAGRIAATGAQVWLAGEPEGDRQSLPVVPATHEALAPLAQAVAFYRFVERLSRHRGFDPDRPVHLNKVTRTV